MSGSRVMKGRTTMQSDKCLCFSLLIYLFILIILVVIKMIDSINMLDVVYFVALISCILKFFMVVREDRK